MSRTDLPIPPKRAVEVLVVDDSTIVRNSLRAIIEAEPAFRVSLAGDPYEAVEAMKRSKPAAVVLDVEMPRMDGITFLKKLMKQHPLPVLICTNHVERGLAALEWGAREVVAKPDWASSSDLSGWGARLRDRLRLMTGLGKPNSRHGADAILPRIASTQRPGQADRVVAVGASTGGVPAIRRLLADLPPESPGVVIALHMPPVFTTMFAQQLDHNPEIALEVAEAGPNELVRPGRALVLPGHAHGLLRRAPGGYRVELVDGPPVSRFRPSIDVLFRSVAQAAGPKGAGVLLTGMLDDGAQGLLEMHEEGGWTIAQDEATSTVFGMPREAIRRGAARQVLPLDRIAAALRSWSSRP
ncbi:MAG TPA: chemotaxis-specific protein-glutamate methyltransferase CheB [Isosphaeraceae bacterium]|jgi:two-component system chemotaxis response regulator CheB|nr:chemotaxis-specific protein-glutamate methyltransferase CheB [Isosphaeraceae bacterium]